MRKTEERRLKKKILELLKGKIDGEDGKGTRSDGQEEVI